MKYVLDASVAHKWVLPEPDSPQAIALRDAYRRQQHELHAPELFAVEVAYVLSKTFHRGVLTQAQATQSLHDVLQISPVLHTPPDHFYRGHSIFQRGCAFRCTIASTWRWPNESNANSSQRIND